MIEELRNLAWPNVVGALIILVLVMELYNLFCTTRKNAREAKKLKEQPTLDVSDRVDALERYAKNDKSRLDNHEMQISDVRNGQKAICVGVQALLEHELHNGNTEEMQKASKGINDWLLNRP